MRISNDSWEPFASSPIVETATRGFASAGSLFCFYVHKYFCCRCVKQCG